ncbi:MAG: hypothetical protein AAF851_22325 [Myxococcota bacterium]
MRRLFLVRALTLGACSDDEVSTALGVDVAQVVDTPSLNFGEVVIGREAVQFVQLRNPGARELALNLLPGQPFGALTIGERDLRLRPGELQQVPIGFSPLVPEPLAARLLVRVRDGAELRKMAVALRGRGIELPLALTPSGLDFGSVALGGSRTLELRLHNRGDQVETLTLQKGTGLEVCQPSLRVPFCLEPPSPDFDTRRRLVLPSQSIRILRVRYSPSADGAVERARLALEAALDGAPRLEVALLGTGRKGLLSCDATTLRFGAVNPGACVPRSLSCRAASERAVAVLGGELSGVDGSFVFHPGFRPLTLSPGQDAQLFVDFCPKTLGDAEAEVRIAYATSELGEASVPVALLGRGGGPDIGLPLGVDWGLGAIGIPVTRTLQLRNDGIAPLVVDELLLSGEGFRSRDPGAQILEPGEVAEIELIFEPLREGPLEGRLLLTSNDQDEALREVVLRGEGRNFPPPARPRSLTGLCTSATSSPAEACAWA